MKMIQLSVALVAATAFSASAVLSQGNPTNNGSDFTGPPTTSSAIAGGFGPGTTAALATQQAQMAVVTATTSLSTSLSTGTLRSVSGVAIASSAQSLLLAVMSSSATTTGPAGEMVAQLNATAGPNASAAVSALVAALAGLGKNAGGLPAAVGEYNNLVQLASPEFLASPPPAMLAIQAALSMLINAAAGTASTS